jgi:asparagine synthase (glutamine-hydrolysing)
MCGISCVFGLKAHSPEPQQHQTNGHTNGDTHMQERKKLLRDLDQSLEKIKHRGPDSRGHWLSADNRVGTLVVISLHQFCEHY